jgi:glucokinase
MSDATIVADVGGTNARFLCVIAGQVAHRATYRPSAFLGLAATLRRFIEDATAAVGGALRVNAAVLAVCGPVWGANRRNESNNIPSWCAPGSAVSAHDAAALEAELAWAPGSIAFLNDFEAIGWALAALMDPAAPPLSVPTHPRALYTPPDADDVSPLAVCVGAGTGLGACMVLPAGPGPALVLPSEAGMTRSISPQSGAEWRLLTWLRASAADEYTEVERLVSGPGIVDIVRWLVGEEGHALSTSASAALEAADVEERAAVIAQYAEGRGCEADAVCASAIDMFLTFYGRFLCASAITFLPYRGLFVAGGILPKLAWRVPCMRVGPAVGSSPPPSRDADPLLTAYLDGGPKMSGTVARVPLQVLDDGDAGLKGALYFAASRRARPAE